MSNNIIINNRNTQNNTRRPRGGSKTGGKELKPCRACNATGWEDFLHMNKCTTCHGTGYVRV